MILLDAGSKIVEEVLREKLIREPEKSIVHLADFDGVTYRISTETKTSLTLSMGLVCFPQLLKHGAGDVLAREYGSYYVQPEQGYNVTISIDLKTLPADIEPLIKALSLLKRNALAAPFERAFSHQQQKLQSELMAIDFRPGEGIYIKALPDRVTVIFSTEFQDETDQIYGKVFLQEFVDARRQPHIQNAPQVLYSSKEPPLELQGVQVKQSDSVGFVTFVFFPRHFQGDKGYECISKIQLFRDYFHYHIKASKAYLHSRMRARVHSFMKVLNRAKPEIKSEQKTAGYFYFDIGAKLFKDRSIV